MAINGMYEEDEMDTKAIKKGDILFTKKKTIIISLLSALVTGIICSMIVYTLVLQSVQVIISDLYGTYQFDMRDIKQTEYLAVIPSSASDAKENEGEFQWYNTTGEVLAQGTCKIDKAGFITFYVDGNSTAMLFVIGGKYYFVDNSLVSKEITKISNEPIVATPV